MGFPVLDRVFEPRAAAAVDGGAHLPEFGIPVLGLRVLARVHVGEAQGPGPVRLPLRIRQAEVVEVDGRLPVVHPVVVAVEFAMDLAVGRELPGHGVPQHSAPLMQVRRSAQGVEQGPVVIALVPVVRAVHARPPITPDEGAVGARVARLVHARGLVHDGD